MNSSDNENDWIPLVPSSLERHERERYGEQREGDPEIEQAFQVLYEKKKEDKELGKFDFLYGGKPKKKKENEKEKIEAKPDVKEEEAVQKEEKPIETPKADLEKIKEEAWAAGFEEGRQKGIEQGLEKAGEIVKNIENTLTEITALREKIISEYEKDLIELVLQIAEKVTYAKIEASSGITDSIINALEMIPEPGDTIITVHPEDYEYIEIVKEDFFEKIEGLEQISIVSDPTIDIGGCKIETKSGEIKTSVEERLEAVRQSVINTLKS